ncbi:MAG: hypothetical protein MHM6MM_002467 [Cercozoa sp. M6MM]
MRVVKAGWLGKRGKLRRSWRRRWFELRDDVSLQFFSDATKSRLLGTLDLKNCRALTPAKDEQEAQPHVLHVCTTSREWILAADSEASLIEWRDAIAELVGGARRVLPTNYGVLRKRGAVNNAWRTRRFVLAHGFLHYFADSTTRDMVVESVFFDAETFKTTFLANVRGSMALAEATVDTDSEDVEDPETDFCLRTEKRVYYLRAKDKVQREEWIRILHKAVRIATYNKRGETPPEEADVEVDMDALPRSPKGPRPAAMRTRMSLVHLELLDDDTRRVVNKIRAREQMRRAASAAAVAADLTLSNIAEAEEKEDEESDEEEVEEVEQTAVDATQGSEMVDESNVEKQDVKQDVPTLDENDNIDDSNDDEDIDSDRHHEEDQDKSDSANGDNEEDQSKSNDQDKTGLEEENDAKEGEEDVSAGTAQDEEAGGDEDRKQRKQRLMQEMMSLAGVNPVAAAGTRARKKSSTYDPTLASKRRELQKQRQEEQEIALREFIRNTSQGVAFVKHGKRGKPHKRIVTLDMQNERITWGDDPEKSLPLLDVRSVQVGKKTEVFKRSVASLVPANCCFSLMGERRTLDLQAVNAETAEQWVSQLRLLVKQVRSGTHAQ